MPASRPGSSATGHPGDGVEGSSARSPSTNTRIEDREPEVDSVGSPIKKRIRDGSDAPSVDAPASKKPRVEDWEEEEEGEVEIVSSSARL